MEHELDGAGFDTLREDFEGMIRVVWWAVALTTGAGLACHMAGWLPLNVPAIIVIAAALQMSSLAAVKLASRVGRPMALYYAAHIVNIVLVTLAIHYAGGIGLVPGPLMYALIVVNGGIVGSRPAHWLATMSTLAYGTLVVVESYGIVATYRDAAGPVAWVRPSAWPAFILLVGAILHVSAAYAARLTALVRTRRLELAASVLAMQAEGRSRQLAQGAAEKAHRDAERLRELNGRYRMAVQTMTHDLKRPISAIYLTAEQLLGCDAASLGTEPRAAVDRIREMAVDADAMIRDLIRLFQIATEPEAHAHVALGDVVRESLCALRETIDSKRIRVIVQSPLPTIWGQPDKLASAVSNVLSNAAKYVSRIEGRIWIAARCDRETVALVIEDNGLGIPEAYHERIFDLFARLPDSHQHVDGERVRGTGVGLALVKRVMELHGGGVRVGSMAPRGARFELCFPTAPGRIAK